MLKQYFKDVFSSQVSEVSHDKAFDFPSPRMASWVFNISYRVRSVRFKGACRKGIGCDEAIHFNFVVASDHRRQRRQGMRSSRISLVYKRKAVEGYCALLLREVGGPNGSQYATEINV